jgi:hypothetical protein
MFERSFVWGHEKHVGHSPTYPRNHARTPGPTSELITFFGWLGPWPQVFLNCKVPGEKRLDRVTLLEVPCIKFGCSRSAATRFRRFYGRPGEILGGPVFLGQPQFCFLQSIAASNLVKSLPNPSGQALEGLSSSGSGEGWTLEHFTHPTSNPPSGVKMVL